MSNETGADIVLENKTGESNTSNTPHDVNNALKILIEKNIHPNPLVVAGFIVALIVVFFVILLFIRPNLTGMWVGQNGRKYQIEHNWLGIRKDKIIDSVGNELNVDIIDNLFAYSDKIGVWDYEKTIYFTNGDIWVKLEEAK